MQSVIRSFEEKYKKTNVVDVRSGDTVKVHQKIREGTKERIQIFEGLVIRADRKGSHTSSITVRRIASGTGVEKTYLLHSPLVVKVEVTKRSKVRRNYLTYMRERTGKSARLSSIAFDRDATNFIPPEVELVPDAETKKEEIVQPESGPVPDEAETPEKPESKTDEKETTAEPKTESSKSAKNKKPADS